MVVFPNVLIPLFLKGTRVVKLAESVVEGDNLVGLFYQKSRHKPGFNGEEISTVGTLARIDQVVHLESGGVKAVADGVCRVRLLRQVQYDPYLMGEVDVVDEKCEANELALSLVESMAALFKLSLSLGRPMGEHARSMIDRADSPGKLCDIISVYLPLKASAKQSLLETEDLAERVKKVSLYLNADVEGLQNKAQACPEPLPNPAAVRRRKDIGAGRQFRSNRRDLGLEDDPTLDEIQEFHQKIRDCGMSEEAADAATRELQRLERISPHSPEYTVARSYLQVMTSLPWNISSEDKLDVNRAEAILNEDHYDLEKVKDRILEFLAVRSLKPNNKGPILCLVGPPGVGKTSLGRSIARSLGRQFIRISLGGVRDEAEIRGHRRTYIGAMPGRIIQEIRRAGTNNPVYMLDEVDKIGQDFRGDPACALLEVLDPEQNSAFVDHYLDVPFDLSKVMFIATANQLDPIPRPLRDRMEVIRIPGYTDEEKLHIAEFFLLPKALEENGIAEFGLDFTSEAIDLITRSYTREAGVRNLEREISAICRKIAREVTQGRPLRGRITAETVDELLGSPKYFVDLAEEEDQVGVATGLAWTESGGDIIFVEASGFRGGKGLTMTGSLGDVMQESAKAALSYLKNSCDSFGVDEKLLSDTELHIHVPAGATPKDGPSAGLTIAVALTSLFSGVPVRRDVAMTGEVTLRGRVLPIGGVKEKLLAARRAGVREVILPEKNRSAIRELPAYVLEDMSIHFVNEVGEAIRVALASDFDGRSPASMNNTRAPLSPEEPAEYVVRGGGSQPPAQMVE
jgi:ATP-dependent Lon protease